MATLPLPGSCCCHGKKMAPHVPGDCTSPLEGVGAYEPLYGPPHISEQLLNAVATLLVFDAKGASHHTLQRAGGRMMPEMLLLSHCYPLAVLQDLVLPQPLPEFSQNCHKGVVMAQKFFKKTKTSPLLNIRGAPFGKSASCPYETLQNANTFRTQS